MVSIRHNPLALPKACKLYFKHLTIAPAKGCERCEEKAANEYGGDFSQIVDVTRCSVVVEDERQLIEVAGWLAKSGVSISLLNGGAVDEGSFVLVRLKNRFAKPCFNAWSTLILPTPQTSFSV